MEKEKNEEMKETGTDATAVSPICQHVVNIAINIPINKVTELEIEVIDWLRLCPIMSTSLTTLDNVSPTLFLSKCERGTLFIFTDKSFLNFLVTFVFIPVIINDCR